MEVKGRWQQTKNTVGVNGDNELYFHEAQSFSIKIVVGGAVGVTEGNTHTEDLWFDTDSD